MSFYNQFDEIREELAEQYLANNREWLLACSFGKDSTMVLLLVWEMLMSLPKELRKKKIHVVTSNTTVETPEMDLYLKTNVKRVQSKADELELPIRAHLATPSMKNRYWFNVLGKGNPPVTPAGRFRWCSSKLKIKPVDELIQNIMQNGEISFGAQFDLCLLLGVRDSESIRRKQSIEKYADSKESKFAKHNTYPNIQVYHPIKFLHGDAIFGYFFDFKELPWGTPMDELLAFYQDSVMECGIKTEGQGNSCGGGRNGCWVCTVVKEDEMLLSDIRNGNEALIPLNEYKKVLAEIRNDVRYREAFRRIELKQTNKRKEQAEKQRNQTAIFDQLYSRNGVESNDKKEHEYHTFDRAEDLDYVPGSLTYEARKLLLQKLLFVELETGFQLIEKEEFDSISDCWQEEGYSIDDIEPLDWQYDGAIVFNQHGELKEKETTNTNPIFWVNREFSDGRDDMIQYIEKRKRATGKSFFYYTSHNDFGVEDGFVYNQADFLVCGPHIQTYEDAIKEIDDWIYEPHPVEYMDWDAFAQRYYDAAEELMKDPNYDIEVLQKINRVLLTLEREPVKPKQYNTLRLTQVSDCGQMGFAI